MRKEEEFIGMIKANEGVIFRITTVYAQNKVDQQDLYQEIVYQLWKSYGSFRKESGIGTWIYRVALNTAITQSRKAKRRPDRPSIDQVIRQQADQKDHLFEERLKALYALIEKLNTLDKGLILLFLEGKSYEEIASITGLSTSNVGTRLSRIRQKLKANVRSTIEPE